MTWIDFLGYAASATVLATFCMKTMIPLRLTAILSNILFASFGLWAHIYPVMILRRERPRDRRAAEQRDEVAPVHSITSSARASSVGGISRPSAFAVVRFTTRSNLVGCSIGRLSGFAPRRILST